MPAGSFFRSYDGVTYKDKTKPADLSAFELDIYEITVGRFRKLVQSGGATQASPPVVGAGAHKLIAQSGWKASWSAKLAATSGSLQSALKFHAECTWTDSAGSNETKPANCMTWWEAFAFCAWDGGRLATEAEWNYAAAGGAEQRQYPWGSGLDPSRGSYNCLGDGDGSCGSADILPVGSRPNGDGKWGHSDLGGNMWEWTLDWYVDPYPLPCSDCAHLTSGAQRVYRGGGYRSKQPSSLLSSARFKVVPSERSIDVGIRCAR